MKKFGKKLVLSGLALAATAATLSTSTYAWYVSNPHAEATGAQAATAAVEDDGSVSLSLTGEENTFYPSVAFTTEGAQKVEPENGVQPVTSADGLTFQTAANGANGLTFNEASSGAWYTYTLYVKVDAVTNVKMTATITNTSSTQKTQIAYYAGSPVTTGKSFTKDAYEAMYMSVTNYTGEDYATKGSTTITAFDATSKGITYVAKSGITSTAKDATADATDNANTYIKNAKGWDEAPADYTKGTDVLPTLTFNEPGVQKLVINMWLEGADTDCFNACAGQSFTVKFDFDLVA